MSLYASLIMERIYETFSSAFHAVLARVSFDGSVDVAKFFLHDLHDEPSAKILSVIFIQTLAFLLSHVRDYEEGLRLFAGVSYFLMLATFETMTRCP